MSLITVLVVLLLITLSTEAVSHCDRTPEKTLRPKNSDEIDKYIIQISGDPSSYVAEKTYTVTLIYNPILEGLHMFKDFMLSVEQEDADNQIDSGQVQHVGYFKLPDDNLSTFSRRCENTVLQTTSVPKSSIQVYWIAPPTGSGCVAFRATVVESKENWYSDDGALTKILCEEDAENEDVQPEVLDECLACDEAKYELVFEGLWTRNTHPKDYPSNIWYTRFGDIVGASHANDESFWQYESTASENIKSLAEQGDTSGLEMELKEKMGKSVRTIIKANGLRYPNITGKSFTFFRVDGKNHLVSFITKITPSPDWVLGVSNFELCLKDGTWAEQRIQNLYPWDIGTNDGVSYNSKSEPLTGQEKIERIKSDDPKSPFYGLDEKDLKPFARLYLTRLKTYKKDCSGAPEITTETETEVTTEEGQTEECTESPWSDWSPCSNQCGMGLRFRIKRFVNPGNDITCPEDLVEYQSCTGKKCKNSNQNANQISADDPRCTLTEWSEWSTCSAKCGKGTMTKDKKFKNPELAAECENNNPLILQFNEECDGEETDCPDEETEDANCSKTVWSPWTSCSVPCGNGIKTRLRMSENEGAENDTAESNCRNKEEVNCFEPPCNSEGTTDSSFGKIPSLNQVTTDTDNIFSQPFGPVANCKVSNWSVWGPCELNEGKCGKGYRSQHRQILQHAINGGKPCPIKLMKKRRCNVQCHNKASEPPVTPVAVTTTEAENLVSSTPTESIEVTTEAIDCIMSPWSQWSPCSHSCGGSAVQQRTRSIRMPARKNGKPCGKRLQQRDCPLPLACTDKGVPIM